MCNGTLKNVSFVYNAEVLVSSAFLLFFFTSSRKRLSMLYTIYGCLGYVVQRKRSNQVHVPISSCTKGRKTLNQQSVHQTGLQNHKYYTKNKSFESKELIYRTTNF